MAAELDQKHCSLTKVVGADFVASVGLNVEQIDVDDGIVEAAADIVDADEKINGHLPDNAGTESSSSPIDRQIEPLDLASAERQSSSTDCSSELSLLWTWTVRLQHSSSDCQ